ncbi:interferon-induced GTP-binding protein Mx2 [Colletotrichum spaethianum]|uniref:Interferon-induced GTP-binding protein Mx2 n=1 Tax=Colletotrichum spaethianum TaxID=700344 RepID=A0AA37LFS6_9PEZI|nr:interferon-induced GTP-binding protein Mx2 [Colletotrichum spaethianum]GKT45678.1 interferon-induced GTP-binding protein Mx2 [Colletotrichum spaethianum]
MAPVQSKIQTPGLGNRNLLDKIDKLRELGISKQVSSLGLVYAVSLTDFGPQLVVVGDQSSGKSSVLESLTGYYFPRSVGLCTRHATEIVCRREAMTSIIVTIQPFDATPERAERARSFRRELHDLKGEEFADVLKEAADVMGLKTSSDGHSKGAAFSKDVLRVEICGPDEEHLTIIDVPGVSTATDVALVKSMVKDYIKDPRTIILAVIPCNVDVATQTILTYAAEADPEGKRTLGVLTKPDLVSENATREAAMDLIRGKRRDIQLGYYVVKNRGADDTSSSKEERDSQEKAFFSEEPWSKLDNSRLGIPALRNRLRELLMDRTKSEFPKVRREINERFADAKAQIKALGQPRSTSDEQRAYLGNIVSRYIQLRDFSLNAYYTGDPLFENNPEYRLATRIREMNSAFSSMFFKSAHTRSFDDLNDDEKAKVGGDELDTEYEDEELSRDDLYAVTFKMPSDEFGDLYGVLSEPCKCAAPRNDSIMKHLEQLYLASRGFEMGTFNNHMLPTAFKEQSKKWESITLAHVSNVILVVHHFIYGVVKEACGDGAVLEALWSSVLEDLVKRYQMAIQQAKLLIHVEREGRSITYNPAFDRVLGQVKAKRFAKKYKDKITVDYEGDVEYVKCSDLEKEPTNAEGMSETCNIIHDVLQSYYDIASARFSDMICTQVIDYFLLGAEDSPLNVLSSNRIYKMTAEQLDMVAGEDAVSRATREMLKNDIKLFEEGRKVLRT